MSDRSRFTMFMLPRVLARGILASALALPAMPALAQVAPPPGEKPGATPEYTPPPPQPTRPQPQRQPQQPSRGDNPNRAQRVSDLPDLPYPPMVVKGEDGRIVPVRDVLDIVAMKHNPTVGPGLAEMIQPVLYARRSRFEELVIENIDLVEMIENGIIDDVSVADIQAMQVVAEACKPLVPPTTLTQELENRGIFTRVQAGFNTKIINEYKQAITEEIQETGGDDAYDDLMKFILEDAVIEARYAYRAMLIEMLQHLDEVAKAANLPSNMVEQLRGINANPTTFEESLESVEAVRAAIEPLSVEQRQNLLRAVQQRRENPEIPPVPQLDVSHPMKKVSEGSEVEVYRGRDAVNQMLEARKGERPDADVAENPEVPTED